MDGVLNTHTNTVHRHRPERSDLESACGVTSTLAREQLQMTTVEAAVAAAGADRCGRCFRGAGGY